MGWGGGVSKTKILKKLQYCTAEIVRDLNVCKMDVRRYGSMIWDVGVREGWMDGGSRRMEVEKHGISVRGII